MLVDDAHEVPIAAEASGDDTHWVSLPSVHNKTVAGNVTLQCRPFARAAAGELQAYRYSMTAVQVDQLN